MALTNGLLLGFTLTSSEPWSTYLQVFGYMKGIDMLLLGKETKFSKFGRMIWREGCRTVIILPAP